MVEVLLFGKVTGVLTLKGASTLCTQWCALTGVRVRVHGCMRVCIAVCMCIFVDMCMCVCVYVCVYMCVRYARKCVPYNYSMPSLWDEHYYLVYSTRAGRIVLLSGFTGH